MRKPDAAFSRSAPPVQDSGDHSRDHASRELVCLALILAVGALLLRIASVW